MATSKHKIYEQVERLLQGGNASSGSFPEKEEILEAIGQVVNSTLKVQFFNETLGGGETIPEGCVLAYYENVPVVAWQGVSKSTLPAIPVKLPRNMGVYSISKTNDPFTSFIPIPMGQVGFVVAQRGMSTLLGQVGYELRGKEVWYTKDLTAQSPAVNSVNMQLVVMDLSKYNMYETLPINADMEAEIVATVFGMFAGKPSKTGINDTTNNRQ